MNYHYDGKATGTHIGDAIREISGAVYLRTSSAGSSGCFIADATSFDAAAGTLSEFKEVNLIFKASSDPKVTVASENRPASTSALACITY